MNIGDRVGDYEIVEVLGRGGMGQVYKIRNVLSERIEAMKVLLPSLEGDKDLADRFLREIKVQGALDHPNIAKLYNALSASNQLLMVMEFIEGKSLEDILTQGPLVVPEASGYAGQVLDALAYAHERGVVHRDIKPANIMRTPMGIIKLLDFGLARIRTERALTQPGTTVGSLYYMSPEQIRGTEPDPRSDLYSLGVVLYEMVTGKRPFQGDSNYAIMAAHLKEIPPPPNLAFPWVPAPLSEIIMTALAKNPAERFQSAHEFRAALGNLGTPVSDQAVTQPLPTLSPSAPAWADTATLVGGAAGASQETRKTESPSRLYQQQPSAGPVAVPPVATVQAQPLTQSATTDPLAAGPGVPSSPPPQSSGSRRGLYMVLGSVATLAVLAFAAIEVPKFLRTHANENKKQETSAPSAPGTTVPAATPTTTTPPASTTTGDATSGTQGTPAAQIPAVTPATGSRPQTSSATPSSRPADNPTTSAATSSAHAAEINKLREEYGLMTASASAAQASLGSLKDQMARQGLGLRGDVIEAENRMNLHLSQAKQAIHAGDTEGAKHHLQMAQFALDSIEKFLGH